MARKKKDDKVEAVVLTSDMEATAHEAINLIEFIYGGWTDQDNLTVRAMILRGATIEQIMYSLTAAAVNQRVDLEDKSRYAFGVLRNLLNEDI